MWLLYFILSFATLLYVLKRNIELNDEFKELLAREQRLFNEIEKEMEKYEFKNR